MRDRFTHNLGLKLISFLIALAIWYKVSFTSTVEVVRVYRVPITLSNQDPALVVQLLSNGPKVKVTLTGTRRDLFGTEGQLEATLDLKNVRSALGEVALKVEAVHPSSVRVVSIDPAVVRVSVALKTAPSPSPGPSPVAERVP